MNFEIGDKVKFLNDVGGGIIKSIDKKLAYVLMDDGFEVPVMLAQLILVEETSEKKVKSVIQDKSLKAENEPAQAFVRREKVMVKPSPEPEPEETGKNPAFSIYYAIVPVKENKDLPEKFDLYLINDSEFMLLFNLLQEDDDYFRSLKSGNLEAETKIFIRSFSRTELNEFPHLKFQSVFMRKGLHKSYPPVNKEIYPDPKDLFSFQGFSENDFFNENAFVKQIVEEKKWLDSEKLDKDSKKLSDKEKEEGQTLRQVKKETLPDTEEVDLHIHELVENHAGMSNGEILEIQMARFTTALEGAIKSKTKRVVFIHGVGNGKLKFEIRKELDKKYTRLKYQDASFKEYGFGATMVILK